MSGTRNVAARTRRTLKLYYSYIMIVDVVWTVILVEEVDDWFMNLAYRDPRSSELVTAAIDQLEVDGPNLGRPLVDRIEDSKIHNLKELRPGSAGSTERT